MEMQPKSLPTSRYTSNGCYGISTLSFGTNLV